MIELPFLRRTKFRRDGLAVRTEGFLKRDQLEIQVEVQDIGLIDEAEGFLRFVDNYLRESGRKILPNETLRYGYWLVKFVPREDNLLEVWEQTVDTTGFVPGASVSLRYWVDQHKICRSVNALFAPPLPESLTAISAGVLDGQPVQGMRYPWPEHMSGWVIVTGAYTGDVTGLIHQHTYHLSAARADIASYLALPPGFGFDLATGKIWYDETSLKEHFLEQFGEQEYRRVFGE